MNLLAFIDTPEILIDFSDVLSSIASDWLPNLVTAVGAVLVAAGAIYLAFIGWRAFKAASSKV